MAFTWLGEQVLHTVEERLFHNLGAMAQAVVADTQARAHKRTGFMASEETYILNRANLSVSFIAGAGYDIFEEFGTRYRVPHPHWRPALNTVGPIYGFQTEFIFQNVPQIHAPILAAGAGFHLPSTLTKKQLKHVREHLLPVSKHYHYLGNPYKKELTNVGRNKMRVQHKF